ncbi:MAG: hypothetical protein WEC12_06775 [Balneolaceae bacterium]
MKNMVSAIGDQLFEPNRGFSRGELVFYKFFELFIAGYVIKLSWEWASYTMRNSEVVLSLGLANYFDISMMFGNSLPLLLAAAITALTFLTYFRIGFRWQYLVILLLFHLQYVSRFSQGEIPHSSNLVGMAVLCFGLGLCFFREIGKRWRFIFGSMIFFIGLGYTIAAFCKLAGTGFTWADGHHLWLWIAEKETDILSREGSFTPNWLQVLALRHAGIATLILLTGWLTELAGVAVWSVKLRPYVITAIIAMHFGITLTMNIRFDLFVMQLVLIGYPWYLLIDRMPVAKSDRLIRFLRKIG